MINIVEDEYVTSLEISMHDGVNKRNQERSCICSCLHLGVLLR